MTYKINGRTPDEIKKGLECCTDEGGITCDDCHYHDEGRFRRCKCLDMRKDALAYIQQFEAQLPKWISVEDPPKHTCDYLVYVWVAYPDGIAHMEMRTGIYNTVYKTWTIPHNKLEAIGTPTHWAQLPEPPKEG